ncbi:MAG TPA: MarR family transcriptional regulator [Actinomycetota bacterium]|nr:MarR family transcriptional regulator [Actinomycetota bacterium]
MKQSSKGGATAPERQDEAVQRFVERTAVTLAEWGFPRMSARVLLTMMVADEDALTAADLAARLGVSPASISGAVRYLIQVGLLERDPVPGSRRDRYRLPVDPWYEVMSAERGLLKTVADLAGSGVEALGADTPGGGRVAEMRDYFRFVNDEMQELLVRWQATKGRAPTTQD